MNAFWTLYKKEVRFLLGPGIGLIVLMNSWIALPLINVISPELYEFNIAEIMRLYSEITIRYLFVGLFLYSILHEHITKSEYQLWILPARRSPHLAAKFISVITWVLISLPVMYIVQTMTRLVQRVLPWLGKLPMTAQASIEVVILGTTDMIMNVVTMCALVMFAYTLAMAIRRFPYMTGIATISAGMIFAKWFNTSLYIYFAQTFPYQQGIPTLLQVQPWITSVTSMVLVILFSIPALILYERYGEV